MLFMHRIADFFDCTLHKTFVENAMLVNNLFYWSIFRFFFLYLSFIAVSPHSKEKQKDDQDESAPGWGIRAHH